MLFLIQALFYLHEYIKEHY